MTRTDPANTVADVSVVTVAADPKAGITVRELNEHLIRVTEYGKLGFESGQLRATVGIRGQIKRLATIVARR